MDIKVSEAVAKYFYNQVCGLYSGHMALIPNNPVLQGLMEAHGVNNPKDFAGFLREVADNLEKDSAF